MPRDDFTEPVRRALRDLAGGLCSNPDCRVATQALATDGKASASIGVAAHIHAASPGGPRFLGRMSPKDRASAKNGLWLCQTCSVRVDRDTAAYPAQLLQQWRSNAADHARKQIGRRAYSNEDVSQQMTQMLTGLPATFAPSAISNVHAAAMASLNALDPRIEVRTAYAHGQVELTLQPKEPVAVTILFHPKDPQAASASIRRLLEHGEAVGFEVAGMSAKGSRLLDRLALEAKGSSSVSLEPMSRRAEMTITSCAVAKNVQPASVHLAGSLYSGSRSALFLGTAWGGLLKYRQSFPYDRSAGTVSSVSMELDLKHWEQQPLKDLAYLDRALALIEATSNGGRFEVVLDVAGKEVLRQKTETSQPRRECQPLHAYLEFLRRTSLLARWADSDVRYSADYFPDEDTFDGVAELAHALEQSRNEIPGKITSCVTADTGAANIALVLTHSSGTAFRFTQHGVHLEIFGSTLPIGDLITDISGYRVSVGRCLSEIQEGDDVEIVFTPGEGASLVRHIVRST